MPALFTRSLMTLVSQKIALSLLKAVVFASIAVITTYRITGWNGEILLFSLSITSQNSPHCWRSSSLFLWARVSWLKIAISVNHRETKMIKFESESSDTGNKIKSNCRRFCTQKARERVLIDFKQMLVAKRLVEENRRVQWMNSIQFDI